MKIADNNIGGKMAKRRTSEVKESNKQVCNRVAVYVRVMSRSVQCVAIDDILFYFR